MEQGAPNLNFNYQSETSNNGPDHVKNGQIGQNSQVFQQPRKIVSDFKKTKGVLDFMVKKRSVVDESEFLYRPAPKKEKVQDSSSFSDKMLLVDQPESKTLPLTSFIKTSNEFGGVNPNHDSRNPELYDINQAGISNTVRGSDVKASTYPVSSGTFPKITDLLIGPGPEGSYSDSQVDARSANSPDAQPSSNNSSTPYACSKCSRTFRTKLLLTHHNDVHDPNKTHRCSFPGCERAFRSQKYLDNHMNDQHRSPISRECPHPNCNFVGSRRSDVKRHIAAAHKQQTNHSFPLENTSLKEIGENVLSDALLEDFQEVLERNVKEIYERQPVSSPLTHNIFESSVNLGTNDHFSPDGTSSTVSAPSFSNGGCVTGGNLTTPPPSSSGNLPNCSSFSPGASCSLSAGFVSQNPPPSDVLEPQWTPVEDPKQFNNCRESAPVTDSLGVRSTCSLPQSPYDKDYCNIPSQASQVQCSPVGDWDPSFQPNGSQGYLSQSSYGPQPDNTRLYQMPQSQEAYYQPRPLSTTMMPYRYYERQPMNSMPYPPEGSPYGRSSLNFTEYGYYQDYCQQHCYYPQNQPQQTYYQTAPQRPRMMNTQQRFTAPTMRSADMSTVYQSIPQNQVYHGQVSQSLRPEDGMNAPGVFQATTAAAPHYNPTDY
ncbi:hypothetical protein Aperf_G00000070916 [Anoplocephala perfoliata]